MFTVIIPFMNLNQQFRLRNLIYVIENYKKLAPDFDIIVIEQNGDGSVESMLSEYKNVKHINLSINNKLFHKTRLLNYAIDSCKSEYIIMSDADCVISANGINIIRNHYDSGSIVYPFNVVDYYNEGYTRKYIKGESFTKYNIDSRNLPIKRFTGLINCFSRTTYNKVGKFDEEFIGWGSEDDAFVIKCERVCGDVYRSDVDSMLIHLFHPKCDTESYKNSSEFTDNKKRAAVIKRMSDADMDEYINKKITLKGLITKYESMNMMDLTLKWKLNNAIVTLDSTIYDIGSFENMSITRILKSIYDIDGKDFMLSIVELIYDKVTDLSISQREEIDSCIKMCV